MRTAAFLCRGDFEAPFEESVSRGFSFHVRRLPCHLRNPHKLSSPNRSWIHSTRACEGTAAPEQPFLCTTEMRITRFTCCRAVNTISLCIPQVQFSPWRMFAPVYLITLLYAGIPEQLQRKAHDFQHSTQIVAKSPVQILLPGCGPDLESLGMSITFRGQLQPCRNQTFACLARRRSFWQSRRSGLMFTWECSTCDIRGAELELQGYGCFLQPVSYYKKTYVVGNLTCLGFRCLRSL